MTTNYLFIYIFIYYLLFIYKESKDFRQIFVPSEPGRKEYRACFQDLHLYHIVGVSEKLPSPAVRSAATPSSPYRLTASEQETASGHSDHCSASVRIEV